MAPLDEEAPRRVLEIREGRASPSELQARDHPGADRVPRQGGEAPAEHVERIVIEDASDETADPHDEPIEDRAVARPVADVEEAVDETQPEGVRIGHDEMAGKDLHRRLPAIRHDAIARFPRRRAEERAIPRRTDEGKPEVAGRPPLPVRHRGPERLDVRKNVAGRERDRRAGVARSDLADRGHDVLAERAVRVDQARAGLDRAVGRRGSRNVDRSELAAGLEALHDDLDDRPAADREVHALVSRQRVLVAGIVGQAGGTAVAAAQDDRRDGSVGHVSRLAPGTRAPHSTRRAGDS